MSFDIVEVDGYEYGTGLQVEPIRTTAFPCYADSHPLKPKDQIRQILADPNWKSGRDRFGDAWIWFQQNLGACNGFSQAGGFSRARVRRGLPQVFLSGFSLYAAINGGRDNGSSLEAGFRYIQEKGIPPQIAGEKPHYLWRDVSEQAKAQASKYKAIECWHCNEEIEIANALADGFDVIVAVHATNAWSRLDGDGISGTSHGVGNHSVLCDGIKIGSNGEFLFDHANSWSLRWGQRGRSYLTWGKHFRETIKHHYFFAIGSTSDGDQQFPVPQEG